MKKVIHKSLSLALIGVLLVGLCGCAALKKKLTRKRKPKPKEPVFTQVRKYNVKPSLELYEKHYIFWINWHKELVEELGKNFKSDIRSTEEMVGNLGSMATLLVDEKANLLKPHIEELKKAKAIIDARTMTKVNETRIRRIVEREYREIKREFSPKKMRTFIRAEWK